MLTSTASGDNEVRIRRVLLGILLVTVAARLFLASLVYARPSLAIGNDSDRYIPIANAIVNGTAYAWNTERPGELLNTIGYPLFLAGVTAIAGPGIGHIALFQLLLSGALAIALYALLARPIGARGAFACGLLLALDPLTALWSMTILTESVFAVAVGISAVLILVWSQRRTSFILVLAGIFMGFACLVKPYALLVAVLWAVLLLYFPGEPAARSRSSLGERSVRAMAFGMPILLLLAPWFVRNAVLWECASLSSVDRVTMRDYVAAKVVAEANGMELEAAQADLQAADPGVCPNQSGKYWRIIIENPGVYLKLHAAGTVPVLFGTNFDRWLQYIGIDYALPDLWRPYMDEGLSGLVAGIRAELSRSPAAMTLMFTLTAFQLLLYLLAVAAFVALLRSRRADSRWLAMVIMGAVAVFILTPGQGGHERFRVPVQPLLMILIALGTSIRRVPRSVKETRLTKPSTA